MTPHTRQHLARLSAERLGLIPRPWYDPQPARDREQARRWGSVLLTFLTMLPVLRALIAYTTKEN